MMTDIYEYKFDSGGYIFNEIISKSELFVLKSELGANGQIVAYSGFINFYILEKSSSGVFVEVLMQTLGSSVQ